MNRNIECAVASTEVLDLLLIHSLQLLYEATTEAGRKPGPLVTFNIGKDKFLYQFKCSLRNWS